MKKTCIIIFAVILIVNMVACDKEETQSPQVSVEVVKTDLPAEPSDPNTLNGKSEDLFKDQNETNGGSNENVGGPITADLFKKDKDTVSTDSISESVDDSKQKESAEESADDSTEKTSSTNSKWINTKLSGTRSFGNVSYAEPTEWNPTPASAPTGMYYYPYGDKSTGMVYFCIQNQPNPGRLPTDSEYKEFVKSTATKVKSSGATTIGGYSGYKAQVTISSTYDVIEYVFGDGLYLYSFMFGDRGTLSKEMTDFAGRMISTVKVTAASASNATPSQTVTATTESAGSNVSSNTSLGQSNALKTAKDYLKFTAFSKKGLYDQLLFEGFSNDEAQYGVDNCGANWDQQAVKMAQNYLNLYSFSRSELVEQLVFEGFSSGQAEAAASAVGY